MNHNPLFSIIVPCYKQEEFMHDALNSVLAQTFDDWECVIVNDGSPDRTLMIAQEYATNDSRFLVVDKANGGLADARNAGILASHGTYILPLDSDDKIGERYLELAIEQFNREPQTTLVYCMAEYFGNKTGPYILSDYSYSRIIWENTFFPSCIFKRSDYDNTSGYNKNMKYGFEDWDFWLSLLSENSLVYCIPEVQFYYRKHGTTMINNTIKHLSETRKQLVSNHLDIYSKFLPYIMEWRANSIVFNWKYNSVKESKAFKIGSAILAPIIFMRSILNMRKKHLSISNGTFASFSIL